MKSVTVGIPAFNEQDNIGKILSDILRQKQVKFYLKRIIVSSDGSTDNTIKLARGLRISLVTVLDNKVREGVAKRQNQMMEMCKSDILVLLDADLAIKDDLFLEKLISPILNRQADLTSADILPIKPKALLGKILDVGVRYKNSVFNNYHHGDNWFTCHGPARAFSKKMYRNIRFTHSVGQDMYSYLYAKYHGLPYKLVKEAVAFYKLPENLQDHERQSVRFYNSTNWISDELGEKFVTENVVWPKTRFLFFGFLTFLRHPFLAPAYAILNFYLFYKSKFHKEVGENDQWTTAVSTKNLIQKAV